MESYLMALEAEPSDWEQRVGELFRAVHTIKGMTGFMGFSRMEKLTHAGEHLLCSLRDKHVGLGDAILHGLFQLLDGVKAILKVIEVTGGEGTRADDEDSLLIADLAALSGRPLNLERESARRTTPGFSEPLPTLLPAACERTLRVDVEVLDHILQLADDLADVRDQIMQGDSRTGQFAEWVRQLGAITNDLRQTVIRARTQPLKDLFGRFPRMVRDLASSCGREVRLELEGQETTLDRSLIEAIKDPVIHALRNAVDHGIESPESRKRRGKSREGRIRLRALSQPGEVVIEISDDGAGIPIEGVRARAVELGFVTSDEARRMRDQETLQMIFLPGFSTAKRVTTISGRGVGMDVIRSGMERVGGSVELESRVGEGTLLRLRLPYTRNLEQFRGEPSLARVERIEGRPVRQIESLHDVPLRPDLGETFEGANGRWMNRGFLEGDRGLRLVGDRFVRISESWKVVA